MGASERDKGSVGEREIVRLLRTYGWPDAERTSNGRAQIGRGDFANGPAIHLDSKRVEKAHVWAWWEQVERDSLGTHLAPVVAFRRSRSPWLALIEFEELLPLLALKERGL